MQLRPAPIGDTGASGTASGVLAWPNRGPEHWPALVEVWHYGIPMMIRLTGICKSFQTESAGHDALADISLQIHTGEVFGIAGKSGAGKSTLLNIMSLQLPPDQGQVEILGAEIKTPWSHRALLPLIRRSAFVHQGFSLLYNLSLADNVALPLKLRGMSKAQRRVKSRDMLRFVGLEDRADAFPVTLSGGEAQRAAIARALVSDPEIIFLDEPTSALDAVTTRDILSLLKKVRRTYDITMVMVAHNIDVLRYMCTRALYLEDGRISRIADVAPIEAYPVDQLSDMWAVASPGDSADGSMHDAGFRPEEGSRSGESSDEAGQG